MKLTISNPKKFGMNANRLNRIHETMQNEVDHGFIAGISTLVARKNHIVHFSQCGYQDRDTKAPITSDTLFRVYSMTKPIVTVALMILFEKGMFDLHDPISKFIPAFADMKVIEKTKDNEEIIVDAKSPITIHQLLTHTSGLVYGCYDNNPACAFYRDAKLFDDAKMSSIQSVAEKIASMPLAFHPGERFYYSVSIDVLGYLIEILSGQSLQNFLYDEIFKPLGMQNSFFYVPENQRHRVAKVYGGSDILQYNAYWSNIMSTWLSGKNDYLDVSNTDPVDVPGFARGGYGLKMTIEDYFKFASLLLNKGAYKGGHLLSPKTVELMQSDHLSQAQMPVAFQDFIFTGLGFGLGGSVLLNPPQTLALGSVGNFGWSGAAKTYFWIDPKEELVGIFMAQSMSNFSTIHSVFQNLVYQAMEC
jgi:CubicO group peptidase (beta-lactamase class C family)